MNRPTLTATQPQMVLQSYLDDLLQEALLEAEVEPTPPPEVAVEAPKPTLPAPVETAAIEPEAPTSVLEVAESTPVVTAVSALPQVITPPPMARVVEVAPSVSVPPVIQEPTPISVSVVDQQPPLPPQPLDGQVPAWGEAPFECLLFTVAGLTLAVPLVSLGSIHLLNEEELTPLFGQPDWFLGILSCPSGNLKVLETARWLIPDRYRDEFRSDLKYAISIQGYDWGLAVHQVSRSIRIHPDEVKWRTHRSQRPWLAGTVIEHMCALLDITALAELIASGATKHKDFLSGK